MDIYCFTKKIEGYKEEIFFHLHWEVDRYEGHVFLFNEPLFFEMVQIDGKWEFDDEEHVPVMVYGAHKQLSEACEKHYESIKAFLKK